MPYDTTFSQEPITMIWDLDVPRYLQKTIRKFEIPDLSKCRRETAEIADLVASNDPQVLHFSKNDNRNVGSERGTAEVISEPLVAPNSTVGLGVGEVSQYWKDIIPVDCTTNNPKISPR